MTEGTAIAQWAPSGEKVKELRGALPAQVWKEHFRDGRLVEEALYGDYRVRLVDLAELTRNDTMRYTFRAFVYRNEEEGPVFSVNHESSFGAAFFGAHSATGHSNFGFAPAAVEREQFRKTAIEILNASVLENAREFTGSLDPALLAPARRPAPQPAAPAPLSTPPPGTPDVLVRFGHLVEQPGADAYLAARSAFIARGGFDPESYVLDELQTLIDKGSYPEARARIGELMPSHLLSPLIHVCAFSVAKRLGDEKGTAWEAKIADAILEGIAATGDGTETRPFIVTQRGDAKDVVLIHMNKARQLKGKSPLAVRSRRNVPRDGKRLEVLTCDDEHGEKAELFFDMTESYTGIARPAPVAETRPEPVSAPAPVPSEPAPGEGFPVWIVGAAVVLVAVVIWLVLR